MKLRLTTLSENTACMGDFPGESGLSILVETEEASILSAASLMAQKFGESFFFNKAGTSIELSQETAYESINSVSTEK